MQKKLLCLLVVSLFLICLPTFTPEYAVSAATTPDDDVNGTYMQVIDGDWVVSKNTDLSDEMVLMNGDIEIQDGSTLTLTNTTIIFNVTSDGQFELGVNDGATLRLLDRDGDPKTQEDGCLITDTTYDTDSGGSSDLSYSMYFEGGSKVYFQNSILEEFTKKSGYNMISMGSDVVFLSGTTFRNAGNFFSISRNDQDPSEMLIDHCLFQNGKQFLQIMDVDYQSSCRITNNTFMDSDNYIAIRYFEDLVISHNRFVNCSGLDLDGVKGLMVEDNTFERMEYTGLQLSGCEGCLVKDIYLNDSAGGVRIFSCQGVTLENVTVYNTSSSNMDIGNQYNYVVLRNSSFKKSGGNNFALNNARLYCYNVDIGMTGDWINIWAPNSYVYLDRVRTTGVNGVFVDHGLAWAVNSTVNATNIQYSAGKSSSMTLLNTSVNMSRTALQSGPPDVRGSLNIGYFLQTNVTDALPGIVYGALVTAKNKYGTISATGITDKYGRTIFPLINRTHYDDGISAQVDYYGPFTVSSLIQGISKTAVKTPKMDRNEYVDIAYLSNTPPSRPKNVKASLEGASINISWEHFCPDYGYFRIYKNNTAGDFVLYNSSQGRSYQYDRFWVDRNAAVNQSTYRYIVKVVDSIGQEGQNTEAVQNGDWVVSGLVGDQAVSDLDLRLNGTLFIIDGGQLTLTNVSISFDNPGGVSIHVVNGVLKTQDHDLDPATKNDNCEFLSYAIVTNMSVIKTTRTVIKADGEGRVELKNTVFSDLGQTSTYDRYSDVRGIYLSSDDNVITGGTFISSVVPVTANDVEGLRISNCTVKGSHEIAFNLLGSKNVLVYNNTIWGADQNAIYMEHTDQVFIIGNRMNNTKGNAIYLWDCDDVVARDNDISKGKADQHLLYAYQASDYFIYDNYLHEGFNSDGIYLYGIFNYSVHDNRIANLSTGIFARTLGKDVFMQSTPIQNYVSNNTITGCAKTGLDIRSTVGGQISRNLLDDCQAGMMISEIKGCILESNRITNCGSGLLADAGVGGRITLLNETYRSNILDIGLTEAVTLDCVNCAINRSKLDIEAYCSLTTKWYVNVTVKDYFGAVRPGANLKVKTLYGVLTANATADPSGRCEWLVVTQNIQKSNGNFTQSPTTLMAIYGNHTGTLSATVTGPSELVVSLTNDIPEVQDVRLLPPDPNTQDAISVEYSFTDPEHDLQLGTLFSWYRNSVLYPAATGSSVLGAQHTNKGEVWFCSVRPSDGIGVGREYNSTSVLIQNSMPWVSDIEIYPTDPDTSMILFCNYTYNDADGDIEGETIFRWYCKNATASDFEYRSTTFGPSLSAGNTNKNDLWRCGIIPHDGEDWGMECLSASVHTNNTPPTIASVLISPQYPTSDVDLSVDYTFYDTDDDLESGSVFEWFVDRGAGVSLGHQGRALPKALTLKGDKWYCRVRPSDGQANGTWVESQTVTIGNSAPTLSGLVITPSSPQTDQNLSVIYDFSDPDQDAENGTIYEWERKAPDQTEFLKLGVSSRTLRAYQVSKGDVVRCRVQPNDGSQTFGQEALSPEVTILNSPPRLSGVALPQAPKKDVALRVSYNYTDPDGDMKSAVKVRWYLDGSPMEQYDDNDSVTKDALAKGQAWTCSVQASDGTAWSAWVNSSEVTLQNAPPTAFDLSFEYPPNAIGMPLSTDDITAHFQYSDLDQDPMGGTSITWYCDGHHVPGMDQKMTLPQKRTNKTDVWNFTLQVYDGYAYSAQYRSPMLDIGNARPVILAPHPDNTTIVIYEGQALEFWVDVFEPDTDPLTYRWYLKGENVWNLESYTLKPDFLSAGRYILNLSISDSDERHTYEVYQEWSIEVKDLNRAPQITEFAPEKDLGKVDDVVMFKIEYSDPDTDNQLEVIWYFDDQVAQRGKGTFTFYPSEGTPGKHQIRAVVSDGHNATEHGWNLTIPRSEETSGPLNITWDKWGFIVQILVISISALLGLIGLYNLRKRQGLISKYLEMMKKVYEDNRPTPDNGLKEIKKVYEEVLRLYEKRKITDSHFLVLERNYDNYVGLFRKYIIMDIDKLNAPAALKDQIQKILKDGKVTEKELTMFKKSVLSSDMSKSKKMNLISIMDSWAHQDKKVEERARNIREKMEPPPPIPGMEEEEEEFEDVDLTEEEEQEIAELFGQKPTGAKASARGSGDIPPPPEAEEKPFEDDEGILDDEDLDLTPKNRKSQPEKKEQAKQKEEKPADEIGDWEDEEEEFEDVEDEDKEERDKGMFDPERYKPAPEDPNDEDDEWGDDDE